jgi:uncharacterized membrane protein
MSRTKVLRFAFLVSLLVLVGTMPATVAAATPLNDVLDNQRLTFTTDGVAPWYPTGADYIQR